MSRWAKATSRSSTNLFFGEFAQSVLCLISVITRFSSSSLLGSMILERSNLPTIPSPATPCRQWREAGTCLPMEFPASWLSSFRTPANKLRSTIVRFGSRCWRPARTSTPAPR